MINPSRKSLSLLGIKAKPWTEVFALTCELAPHWVSLDDHVLQEEDTGGQCLLWFLGWWLWTCYSSHARSEQSCQASVPASRSLSCPLALGNHPGVPILCAAADWLRDVTERAYTGPTGFQLWSVGSELGAHLFLAVRFIFSTWRHPFPSFQAGRPEVNNRRVERPDLTIRLAGESAEVLASWSKLWRAGGDFLVLRSCVF